MMFFFISVWYGKNEMWRESYQIMRIPCDDFSFGVRISFNTTSNSFANCWILSLISHILTCWWLSFFDLPLNSVLQVSENLERFLPTNCDRSFRIFFVGYWPLHERYLKERSFFPYFHLFQQQKHSVCSCQWWISLYLLWNSWERIWIFDWNIEERLIVWTVLKCIEIESIHHFEGDCLPHSEFDEDLSRVSLVLCDVFYGSTKWPNSRISNKTNSRWLLKNATWNDENQFNELDYHFIHVL